MFSHFTLALIPTLLPALISLGEARVDLGGGYMGLAMAGTSCPTAGTIGCTELDDDWPDMGLACPEAHHDIPRHTLAIMSATVIQLGHYKVLKKEEFPIDECYTSRPNSTVAGYGFISQGSFDMWFFAHDKCDCKPKQTPVCNSRATEADKCNLRTFTLCKVTKKKEICKPKHHPGWQPLPTIEDSGEIGSKTSITELKSSESSESKSSEDSNESTIVVTKVRFDPTSRLRMQSSFDFGLGGAWWRLMEIFGFWGAI